MKCIKLLIVISIIVFFINGSIAGELTALSTVSGETCISLFKDDPNYISCKTINTSPPPKGAFHQKVYFCQCKFKDGTKLEDIKAKGIKTTAMECQQKGAKELKICETTTFVGWNKKELKKDITFCICPRGGSNIFVPQKTP